MAFMEMLTGMEVTNLICVKYGSESLRSSHATSNTDFKLNLITELYPRLPTWSDTEFSIKESLVQGTCSAILRDHYRY